MIAVAGLALVRKKNSHQYPSSVKKLIAFILEHIQVWPVVADYLRRVSIAKDLEVREREFRGIATVYLLDQKLDKANIRELWELLESVYALSSRHVDPRTLVLEYIVYKAGPLGATMNQLDGLQRECQCSVYYYCGDENPPQCLVGSNASFDVAFLSDCFFEGYECKVKLSNWLHWKAKKSMWKKGVIRKLDFMTEICVRAGEEDVEATVYLAGLERSIEPYVRALRQNGYSSIAVLGANELEGLIA